MAATTALTKCSKIWSGKKLLTSIRLSSFQALGINGVLVEKLAKLGIKHPSEIQENAIPAVIGGRNTIINAETGSGKTLCYLLPIVNNLINNPFLLSKPPHAIILLPTRELCHQVASVFKSIADPHMHPCIVNRDSKLLVATSYPVVMAMPSALLSYNLDTLRNASVVVTDEADFLTTSGGKDVWKILNFLKLGKHKKTGQHSNKTSNSNYDGHEQIHSKLNPERQFVFVAATMPSRGKKASLNVLNKWLPNTKIVTTSIVHQKLPSLDVEYVKVSEHTKLSQLSLMLNQLAGFEESKIEDTEKSGVKNTVEINGNLKEEIKQDSFVSKRNCHPLRVMVFTNTAQHASTAFQYLTNERNLDELSDYNTDNIDCEHHGLDDKGTKNISTEIESTFGKYWKNNCAELHKEVPIEKRLESLERFKSGKLEVLICTDIASRGLDIPDVTHVIQLDFASNAATFLHRTGRTARAGSLGKVINFITPKDEDLARALRACDDGENNVNYEATFSRNRMFRRRIKTNALALADSI